MAKMERIVSLRLTSLLRVEERLLEAEYFVKRMARKHGEALGYDLNAFLSASRSVTFLLQKEFSKVDGFPKWWAHEQAVLANDPAARFFLKLRNYSQKEGRISLVGVASPPRSSRKSRWSYRFAGTVKAVPIELMDRDIVDCCREHLAKLAQAVLRFSDDFPFHSCPSRALTTEGVRSLRIDLDEVDMALGYPRGWSKIAAGRQEDIERIRCLAGCIDAVDFVAIKRISRLKPRLRAATEDTFGERIARSMVAALERRRDENHKEDLVSELVLTELVRRDSNGTV